MSLETLQLGLTAGEIETVRRNLGREPNDTEWSIIDAEWSEHSSYKSSKALLKLFPTKGRRVVLGPGYDAGVVDVGGGYVITVHIESHNHPSAVDPYGGASTGIGGVLRDILSMGTRPIALVDILRFGRIDKSPHSRWLFRNVVRGIADYGNCISGEDLVYFTNSGNFHVAEARKLFAEFASENKLTREFSREDLTISRPAIDFRVLSFDFEKKKACFRKVSRMYQAKVTRLIRIRTSLGRTISVTPDHPMFVVRDGIVQAQAARTLRVGDSVPLVCDFPFSWDPSSNPTVIDLIKELSSKGYADRVTVTCNGRSLKELRTQLDPLLRKIGVKASQRSHYINNNYIPLRVFLALESTGACPLARTDLLLYPRRGRVNKVPAVMKVDSDFSRLVGYFLSEGCNHDEKGTKSGGRTSRIIWTFRTNESEYIADLCAILEKAGIKYGKRQTKTNAIQVRVSSQILGWMFRDILEAGSDSYTKRIPNLFYRLSPELSFEVLKGIVRGDGSLGINANYSSARLRFGSSSPVLFQQVLLLFQSLGYVPSTETTYHTKSTVPFHELTIHGRTRIELLKNLFSKEVISGADRRLSQYSRPVMEHYRSKSYEKFATVKISQIEEFTGEFSVYNFEVDETHNYVTSGGIITHNCVGVPTVAGDIEFDESFERNCLVDVACVGLGKKKDLILGEARTPGDIIVLIGGSTGRDGIRGATFASKNLSSSAEEDRSSVQVPDPFMKKLLLDALIEAVGTRLIRGMKDLGGGGLSTALSEIASSGRTGIDAELSEVRRRENDMSPTEIMISESQERMLLVLAPGSSNPILEILQKYEVPYSVIGRVTGDGVLTLRWKGKIVARLPAELVVRAPLIPWPSRRPAGPDKRKHANPSLDDAGRSIVALLSSPNIASKRWVYRQYDHEVGVRTVVKPGQADAALMRLPNGKLIAIKGDGNSAQCSLDPYNGAAGCVAESCRNVVALGAEPVALVDHLQFGDPSDPEVYWSFGESIRGMADYCRAVHLPVVGGKVSFYNEDSSSRVAIKPSPIALVVGLVEDQSHIPSLGFGAEGESVFVVGETRDELGGSEFYRRHGSLDSGNVPKVDPSSDQRLYGAMLKLIRSGVLGAVHDCSKGGLAVALAEMSIAGGLGARIDLRKAPSNRLGWNDLLFSESHGRFVLTTDHPDSVERLLVERRVPHGLAGVVRGDSLLLFEGERRVADLRMSSLRKAYEGTLGRLMD